ncbi:MAG: 50S ribosomal protein L24 [Anaerolineae bacterium]
MMNKIRKGDTVKILTGKDVGKTGVVHSVSPKKSTLIVSGVNMIKKAQRRTNMSVTTQAGIIQREGPIHISNVALVCKNCGKPTRVGFQMIGEGQKSRVCKKCGEAID